MDILDNDTLLYLINIIKLDEDKNLTLMYWSWTNKYYHKFIKPLIEIDEVVIYYRTPYQVITKNFYGTSYPDIANNYHPYLRYNPYWTHFFKNNNIPSYKVIKLNSLLYKYKSVIIGWSEISVSEKITYDYKKVYGDILNKIRQNINNEQLVTNLLDDYDSIKYL